VPVLFRTGSALGIHPSEVSCPGRFFGLSAVKNPLTVSPAVSSAAESVRPARRASVSGFTPSGIALRPHSVLSRRPLAPPLGLPPLGLAAKASPRTSPKFLSHACPTLVITHRISRRHRVSLSPRFPPTDAHTEVHDRPRKPLWGFCTCPFLSIQVLLCPGY
jgi:hypothetical protein